VFAFVGRSLQHQTRRISDGVLFLLTRSAYDADQLDSDGNMRDSEKYIRLHHSLHVAGTSEEIGLRRMCNVLRQQS
jgi:hypothetical protein